jgi:hypothetical protein
MRAAIGCERSETDGFRASFFGEILPLRGDVANGGVAQCRSSVKAASGGSTGP